MTPGAARRSFTLLSLGAYVILGTHTFDSAAFFAIIYIREAHAPFQIRYDFQLSRGSIVYFAFSWWCGLLCAGLQRL